MLFVLLLMLIGVVLGSGISSMWNSMMSRRTAEKDGLIAFYCAQAGIERGKAELGNGTAGWLWAGTPSAVGLGEGNYSVAIATPAFGQRDIISTGEVRHARRTITLRVDNSTGSMNKTAYSWAESF